MAPRASLRDRLARAERTIEALLADKVDAVLDQASTSAVMLREAQHELRSLNERLEHSEAYFRSLIENVSDLITVLDADATIRYIGPSVRRVLGYEPSERIGRQGFDIVHPDDAPKIRAFMAEAVARGAAAAAVSYRVRHRDGSWRHFESSGRNLLADDAVRGVVVTSRDVTEQLEMEEQLRHSEAEHRDLIERAPLGIYRSTSGGRFVTANPALVAMLGYESSHDLQQLNLASDVYLNADDRRHFTELSAHEAEASGETQWRRKDGTPITVKLHVRTLRAPSGTPTGLDCFAEDVTAQRTLERQLQQAQRLEAVGRLAGGVAHDFNNLLTAMIGYSDLLLDDLKPGDHRRDDVAEIRAAAERATDLTRQLLAFSRRQVMQTRLLDLNGVVGGVEKMLRRLIGEDIRLVTVLSASPVIVRADPGQVEQVLLNLAVNARDAMADGGMLTIETACLLLDESDVERRPEMAPGPYVMLAVTDTGAGMSADVLSHLFEPFFTTKEQGKGTGLGLATVYGIVKQSGGWIWVSSEPGGGSAFKVYLPHVEGDAEHPMPLLATPDAVGGVETILVAEDDTIVRQVISRVLEQKGYQVLVASDGARALEVAREYEGAIDLLLTDLVMPGMTGRELVSALTAERPQMHLLFMSGYTDDAAFRRRVLDPDVSYLQKPFNGEALALKVRQVLDTPVEPPG